MRPSSLFFFTHTATTEIYTLSLHDALPIFRTRFSRQTADQFESWLPIGQRCGLAFERIEHGVEARRMKRSEEHTSELQSRVDLVCRLLLEKKKKTVKYSNRIGS